VHLIFWKRFLVLTLVGQCLQLSLSVNLKRASAWITMKKTLGARCATILWIVEAFTLKRAEAGEIVLVVTMRSAIAFVLSPKRLGYKQNSRRLTSCPSVLTKSKRRDVVLRMSLFPHGKMACRQHLTSLFAHLSDMMWLFKLLPNLALLPKPMNNTSACIWTQLPSVSVRASRSCQWSASHLGDGALRLFAFSSNCQRP